jgi:hypothetical protein
LFIKGEVNDTLTAAITLTNTLALSRSLSLDDLRGGDVIRVRE